MSCGSDTNALALYNALTAGADFNIPDIDMSGPGFDIPGGDTNDLYKDIDRVTNDSLTERKVDGEGTFDYLMTGVKVHLDDEFKKNRITGAEYVKTYIALSEAAMSNAVGFLLGRDQSYWQAVTAQVQAIQARVALAVGKMEFSSKRAEALTNSAGYALTKLKLSTEDITYCTAKANLEQILPKQAELLVEQVKNAKEQVLQTVEQTALVKSQQTLVKEQADTQRANTLDFRADGLPVTGLVGRQKELYAQQITSYKRDSEVKVAKLFADAWTVQKTVDEGLLAPNAFTNPSVDEVMTKIKTNNQLF